MAIYTKTGDKGKTSMYDAKDSRLKRVDKDSLQVEAIGAVDELNSYLGVVKTSLSSSILIKVVNSVQSNLLTIGSSLAGSGLKLSEKEVLKLEEMIDEWECLLPVLANFIIPGGSVTASHVQYSRALARRAERRVVAFSKVSEVSEESLKYLNRLSDFLFMAARYVNHSKEIADSKWIPKKK